MLSPANRFCSPPTALRLIGPARNCPLSPPPPQAHPWIPPPPPPLRSHHQGCSHLGKGRAGVLHDHHHAGPDKRTAEVVDDVLVTQGAQHLDLMQQLLILLRGHLQLLDPHQQPLAVHPEVHGAEPAGPEHGAAADPVLLGLGGPGGGERDARPVVCGNAFGGAQSGRTAGPVCPVWGALPLWTGGVLFCGVAVGRRWTGLPGTVGAFHCGWAFRRARVACTGVGLPRGPCAVRMALRCAVLAHRPSRGLWAEGLDGGRLRAWTA